MSRAVFLMGTSITEAPKTTLSAASLSAEFDQGALRWIRWRGIEILRGVAFLVRTPGWGTPEPQISELSIQQNDDAFKVRYQAHYVNGEEQLTVDVSFEGHSEGFLSASARIVADTNFTTNRTGFVVLYPLEGVVGTAVQVEHADGENTNIVISDAISPGQPIFNIHAITHHPVENLSVATRFEGDVFEAEDHRNWSDASFKIYNRPIALPHPYSLQAGQELLQSVTVRVKDDNTRQDDHCVTDNTRAARVEVGAVTRQSVPVIGLGLSADASVEALDYADQLSRLGPIHFLLRYDPTTPHKAEHLLAAGQLAATTNLPIALELLLTASHDPAEEIGSVAKLLQKAEISPLSVAIFPKNDERSFQPGELRPQSPSDADIYAEAKKAFPDTPVGGGSPAFFTEFNRKRPSPGSFDFITHATAPTVHAADDVSVIETLQSLPHIIKSARKIIQGADKHEERVFYRIGPVGIGARLNPYGNGPVANPDSARVGLAANDPRQRGLFAAAWHVGYAAIVAKYGVDALIMGAPTGPFGVVSTRQPYLREWWDDQEEGHVYPLFHVVADLASGSSKPRLDTTSDSEQLAVIGWQDAGQNTVLIANLSGEPVKVNLVDVAWAQVRLLDVEHIEIAVLSPQVFRHSSEVKNIEKGIDLDAYAVATIRYQRN